MKIIKILVAFLLMAMPIVGFAQESEGAAKPKKKFDTPKAGEFGLGLDVVPFLSYVGNLFNGHSGNTYDNFKATPSSTLGILAPEVSLLMRYMLTDRIALRANLGFLYNVENDRRYIEDDAARAEDMFSQAKVTDNCRKAQYGGSFALGAQYRWGQRRVQGYAGADLMYIIAYEYNTMTYGNGITDLNQAPSRTEFKSAEYTPKQWNKAYVVECGDLQQKTRHKFGGALHIGMEVFLNSYISIGGEISLSILGEYVPQQYQILEGYNIYSGQVETWTEITTPPTTNFHMGIENLGGKLYIMFYLQNPTWDKK